jgi:hypothetical protein
MVLVPGDDSHVRAVQSPPFPPCAPRHRGGPVGQGAGWGPQGSLPDPAHLGPTCEKSRFQDQDAKREAALLRTQALTNCG